MRARVAAAGVVVLLAGVGDATAGWKAPPAVAPGGCEFIRIMDEQPFLSGTRYVQVCSPTKRTYWYEDPSDYAWSYVKLDGKWVGIPPDSRVGTWNP